MKFKVTDMGQQLDGEALVMIERFQREGREVYFEYCQAVMACFAVNGDEKDPKPMPRAEFDKAFKRMSGEQIAKAFDDLLLETKRAKAAKELADAEAAVAAAVAAASTPSTDKAG